MRLCNSKFAVLALCLSNCAVSAQAQNSDDPTVITIEYYIDTTGCDAQNPITEPVQLNNCYRGSSCEAGDCPEDTGDTDEWEMFALKTNGDGEEILVLQTYSDVECTSLLKEEQKVMNRCQILPGGQSIFYAHPVTITDGSAPADNSNPAPVEDDATSGTQTDNTSDDTGKEVRVLYYLNTACEGEDLRASMKDYDIDECYFEHEDELPYYFKWQHLQTDGESRITKSYYIDNNCVHLDPAVEVFDVTDGICNALGSTNSMKILIDTSSGPQVGFGFD